MGFQMMPVDDLVRIAAAGGGFRLDASMRDRDDLIRIAAAAKNGGGVVTFRGLSMRSANDLITIAAAGKGHVILED